MVNPNDGERYPADSYEAMRERVRGDGGWPVPYLRDESQEAAREFGAKTTPDVFVFDADGRLRYRGAPDADHMDPSLTRPGCGRRSTPCLPSGRSRAAGDRPGGLQRQVARVTAASTRSVSPRPSRTVSAPASRSASTP